MRFYYCFFTYLPDEFVEAHISELVDWAMRFDPFSPKYLIDNLVLEGFIHRSFGRVAIQPSGHGTGQGWDRLNVWMAANKGKYSGGYWKSLTPDQRDPNRAPGYSGGAGAISAHTITNAGSGYAGSGPGLNSAALNALTRQFIYTHSDPLQVSRPALKREVHLGEIVGYRCWRIENGMLRSVYQKDLWHPGQVLEGRELKDWDHRGVHAWKEPGSSRFQEYLTDYLASGIPGSSIGSLYHPSCPTNVAMVTGSILLWGDVVEHEYGYRGEFAKIKSLDWLYPSITMMGKERETLDGLRKDYGL